MARIRSLKPSFWADPDVAALRRDSRLMLIGLICFADDEGRFVATATAIGGNVFPHDELAPLTVRRWRDEIAKSGVVELYVVDGREYGHFPKWTRHQRVYKPTKSILPEPPGVNGWGRHE